MVKAILVDLDGTLLDTAPDLAAAANAMLARLGRAPRTLEEVQTFVGKGIARLVERCLTGDLHKNADAAELSRALEIFREEYEKDSGLHSAIYPGVVAGLEAMKERGLKLACVTNKAARFTGPLLERKGLAKYFEVVVCGDMVERGKPDPACYRLACERLGLQACEVIVIGDSENDVLAARAAGMKVWCVPYGYNEGRPIASAGCDGVLGSLDDAHVALGGAAKHP
jgi:phosphoglycolate phosphatase